MSRIPDKRNFVARRTRTQVGPDAHMLIHRKRPASAVRRMSTLYGATSGHGTRYSAALLAEYSPSKRTAVYGAVDCTRATGATADFLGRDNQTGVAVGLRNVF